MNDYCSSRRKFLKSGALVVAFSLAPVRAALSQATEAAPVAASRRTLNPDEVDAFIAILKDGSVVLYSGKVDLGTGHRISMRQMVAEELAISVDRIEMIEGDTALTPDQGSTAGSNGVVRGGAQLRQAAASARDALIARAAARLQKPAAELVLIDGYVQTSDGAHKLSIAQLIGDNGFSVKVNPKAQLKKPGDFTVIGRSLPRPDIPAKMTARHVYVHDFKLPGMLHGRTVRPATVGAKLLAVDESSVKQIPGVRVVRMQDFLGVVGPDEWAAIRASRELKASWSQESSLVGHATLPEWARRGPYARDEVVVDKGSSAALAQAENVVRAAYYWPVQSHGSIGPSCAVADVRADGATIWTASQATHRFQPAYAQMLQLARERVRLVYLDGAGCYGMNGHDDAAADAALLSKATGRPVRVQWMREDELGWDPKGPPQLIEIRAALNADLSIAAWQTEMWLPLATANLEHVPLLGPQAAGIAQPVGQSVGQVTQNGDPPYRADNVHVSVHWLARAPLRPSNIRAPGKVGNCFAVESFIDELAAAGHIDPLEFRLKGLSNPRGIEVLKRTAALIGWAPRSPNSSRSAGAVARGRGIAYVHYKQNETLVAAAMDVEVDRQSGAIHVKRIACAHDCGLMINPNAVRAQVEGSILQTLSRTLYEETTFDSSRVTSVNWASYPILRFPEVPELLIDLVDRRFDPPFGAGEAASTPVPAALANAVFDATGARLREVPFTPARVLAALRAVV